jgi:hypothetical protein
LSAAGGKLPLWATSISTLSHLGVGVSLYFSLLKDLAVLLVIMTIIAAPMTYIFYIGSRMPDSAPNPLGLAAFSLGNIGSPCVTRAVLFFVHPPRAERCVCSRVFRRRCRGDVALTNTSTIDLFGAGFVVLKGNRIGYLITFCDVLNSLIFFFSILAFRVRMNSQVKTTQKKMVSIADFSVFVRNLPASGSCARTLTFCGDGGRRHHLAWCSAPPACSVWVRRRHLNCLCATACARVCFAIRQPRPSRRSRGTSTTSFGLTSTA